LPKPPRDPDLEASTSEYTTGVIVALLAARPWSADWKTCELVSPSAGMLVWTSSTAGSANLGSGARIRA
jgi:hypothetical protein